MVKSVTESAAVAVVMYMVLLVLWTVHNFSCHILRLVPRTLLVFTFVIWHLHYTCKLVEFTTPRNKNLIPGPKPEQFLLYPYGATIKRQWGWNITPPHLEKQSHVLSKHCISPQACSRTYCNWHTLGNDFSCPVVVQHLQLSIVAAKG